MHFSLCPKKKNLARRRNAAKRKKLKSLGKSKSTDTEEEEGEEDYGDDGMLIMKCFLFLIIIYKKTNHTLSETQKPCTKCSNQKLINNNNKCKKN